MAFHTAFFFLDLPFHAAGLDSVRGLPSLIVGVQDYDIGDFRQIQHAVRKESTPL